MKIVFLPAKCTPFHARTLEERPLGGTETAIIRLAEALDSLGQEVSVISDSASVPSSHPSYISHREASTLRDVDALIVVRDTKSVTYPCHAKKRFYWTGDSYYCVGSMGLGDKRCIAVLDGFLAVSEWHADTVCKTSLFPREKTYILRNGIKLENFAGEEKRERKRLIYSSVPDRGLVHLPEIFLELKRRHADAELVVINSSSIYRSVWPYETIENEDLMERLRSLPGCRVLDAMPQHLLAREFMKAAILAYTSHFKETSCITAMEAQAGGAVPVTTALAALPETVGDAGILIEGTPGTKKSRSNMWKLAIAFLQMTPFFTSFLRGAWNVPKVLTGTKGRLTCFNTFVRGMVWCENPLFPCKVPPFSQLHP